MRLDHRQQLGVFQRFQIEYAGLEILQRDLYEGFQTVYGDQRLSGRIANPLGQRYGDPQSGVGAGTLADGHGIQFVGIEIVFPKDFLHVYGQILGMMLPLEIFAQRKEPAVFRQGYGTDVGAGLDT